MIRLALSGAEETTRQGVAARLRGATIEGCLDSPAAVVPEGCNAVVFVGPVQPEPETIQGSLRLGKHVLLATEHGVSRALLEAFAAEAKRANVQLAVCNPDRYLPSRQLIRQQLDSGKPGTVGLVRIHRWEPGAPASLPESPQLPMPLIRDLDLALFLAGKPPQLIFAVHAGPSGGFLQVHLGFEGGGMALIDYTGLLPSGDGYQSLSVIASSGALYADDHQNVQLVYRGGHPQAVRSDEGARQLTTLLQEFVSAVQAGQNLSETLSAWRTVWTVADAVRHALESRQAVSLGGN